MNNDPSQPQKGLHDMSGVIDTQQEYQAQPPVPLPKKSRLSLSKGKAILLIGLVLLVLVGAVGLFFLVRNSQTEVFVCTHYMQHKQAWFK